jgi:adenine specific DNA methylase Mod
MNIYETRNKQYSIQKVESPFLGTDISEYVIAKYDSMLHRWNGFYVFRPEEKLEDCFNWLLKNNKISKEEYNLNLDKFKGI